MPRIGSLNIISPAFSGADVEAKLGAQTKNGFAIGNGPGNPLNWTAAATNGQVPIGVTNGIPVVSTLTSGIGISITNGPGSITIEATGSTPGTFTEDIGSATPFANNLNVFGTAAQGITTSGGGSTITISANNATTTTKGVASFNATQFSLAAGAVSSNNFTITAGTGLTGGGSLTLGGSTAISLSVPVTVANGGTGATTLTGILTGNGTGAFTASPVTQFDVLVGGVASTVSSVGPGSAGQVLQSNGGAANPAYSTAIYPSTTTINQILYSISANVVSGLATSNNGVLITSATGVPSFLANGTTGQILTATTGSPPSWVNAGSVSSITITGDTGGSLTGNSFTFTGGTTGLTFNGAGSTETLSGTLTVANGGTGASTLTGVLTGHGTAAFTASPVTQFDVLVGGVTNTVSSVGPGSAGQVLQSSGGAANPAYSTAAYPSTTTTNQILYSPSANVVSGLSTDNNGVLITSATGVPSFLANGITGQILTATTGSPPSWVNAGSVSSITITGDTGGSLTGNSFTFTGGTTGLTFNGAGSTETLSGTLTVANGGTGASTLTGVLTGHGTGAFTASPVTQFDVLVGGVASTVSSVGPGSAGQVLQSNGGAANPAYSTAIYPSTTTINQILYSISANVVSGLATSNNGVLITSATGVPSFLANGITGQILTATTGSPPSWVNAGSVSSITITGDTGGSLTGNSFTFTGGTTGLTFNGAGSTETLSGTLTVANGGTGASTLTGVLTGHGTAAFTASPVTQFDVLVGGVTNTVSSVGPGSAGQVLQSSGGAANPAYSTATYPVSTLAGQVLYSPSANVVTGLGPVVNGVLITNASSIPLLLPNGTTGQVLTATTGSPPSWQNLPPPGSITITGDTGGGLSNTSFIFTGGTTGLTFNGAGSTETLDGTLVVANGGTGATTLTGVLTGNGTGAFTASPVIQFDVVVGGVASTLSSVGPGSAGQVLQSSGNAANPAYSTTTYPSTTTIHQILYSSAANVVSGLATANNGVLITSTTGVPSLLANGTTGQVLTATTGSPPSWQNLPPPGSITITGDSGGGLTGTSFIFTGGTTGLTFNGAGSTETLGGTLVVANGGTGAATLTGVLTGNGTGAFTASPVTQFDVLVGGVANAISSVGPGSAGQVLQSSGNAANPAYSTATYPSTTTINQILYSSAADTVSGLATGNNGVLITSTTGVPSFLADGTTGQVLTATTGSPPSWESPAASSITITGDSGGGLTGNSFTFTGGTTGLTFNGVGTTETLGGTLVVANGGTGAATLTGVLTGNGTAAFTASPVTQFDVLVGGVSNAISSVGPGSAGQVLQSSGNAANPAYSTATYPSTTTINQILYASAANTVSGLATGNNGVLITSTTGVPSFLADGTTGQVLTATTGSPPSWEAPAASSITITGNTGGGLTGNSFTFTGGTTGLTFNGVGTTETLGGTLVVANGGTGAATLTGVLTGNGTAAFTASPVTQFDVLVGGVSNAISSVGPGSAGQVLQSSGNAANPAYSTATYPSTTTINQILYASAANTVSGLATGNNGVLITSTTGVPSFLADGTTGQVLTATTGSPPSWEAPAASSITITGNTGGGLTGNSFTFTGGTTGLTFNGAGTTETLGGTLVVANGGTGAATLTGVLTGNGTAAFTASPVTQFDVLVGGVSNAISSVGPGSAGQVLQSSGNAANPAYSTATYPSTTTINQILYSSAANTVSGLVTGNNGVLITSATGAPSLLADGTTGQVLTATTGAPPSWTTLTTGVSSVTGTANQILASPTTGAVVLSLIGPYTPAAYTAHGVLVGEGTSSIVAVGPTATTGQVLQNNAGADPTYSTATYPSTTTINQILYSSAANTVSGLVTGNNGVLITSATGVPSLLANGTTGQVLTATTGSPPSWEAPAASSITITGNTGGGLTGNSFTFTGGTTGLTFNGAGTTETLGGTLVVANGGTGAATLTGVLTGNGTAAFTASPVTQFSLLLGGASNTVASLGVAANGAIPIGAGAGANPVLATLSAGTGVTIVNGAGSVMISASGGGLTWTDVTGPTQAMAANNGYTANNAGVVTLTLPATAAYGTLMAIVGKGTGGWSLAQNAGQIIHFGNTNTTSGTGGSIASTNQYDVLYLLCTVANTDFTVIQSIGNLTIT